MNSARATHVELTNLCRITDGDMVLMENRVDPDWSGYVFPGGHIESGESVVESVIREVREETGLEITNIKLCGIQDWDHGTQGRYMVFFFTAEKKGGTLTDSEEGHLEWIPKDKIKELPLVDGMDLMLRIFDEDLCEMYHPLDCGWNARYY